MGRKKKEEALPLHCPVCGKGVKPPVKFQSKVYDVVFDRLQCEAVFFDMTPKQRLFNRVAPNEKW